MKAIVVIFAIFVATALSLECDSADNVKLCENEYASCTHALSDASTSPSSLCPCLTDRGTCLNQTGCYGDTWNAYGQICTGKPNCTGCLTTGSASFIGIVVPVFIVAVAALFA